MANHSSMAGTYTFSVAVANGADLSRNADYVRQLRSGGLESQSRPYPGFPGHLDAVSHAADPYDSPALHYPQAMLQRKRHSFIPMLDTSVSPSSSGYSPSPSSASVPSPLSATLTSDPDDAWNLIPYHVSWGHEYEEYRAGTLPGPDGDCIFLRSPTPLRNQRASEACKKCRERKAKCTGARPACARCTSRDYVCEYASETAAERSPIKVRRTPQDLMPKLDLSSVQAGQSVGREAPMHVPSHEVSVKNEESESMALRYMDHPSTPSACWEGSTPSDDFPMEEPWQFSEFTAADEEFSRIHQAHLDGHLFSENGGAHSFPPPSSILAPQPVRHSSVSHLSSPGEDVLPASYTIPLYAPMHPPAGPLFHNAPADQSHFVNIYPSPELKTEPDYGVPLSYLSSTTSMLGLQEEQEYGGAIDPYNIDVEVSAYAIHLPSVHSAKRLSAGYPASHSAYGHFPATS